MTAMLITCPFCDSPAGERCRTASGREAPNLHRTRWDEASRRYRHSEMRVRIREDDPRFGLKAGEVYTAIAYWLDPGAKVALLAREPDGYNPECNIYHRQGELLGFL